ncbi:hypothetical protein SAMN05421772_103218 [Paracoccus saliphilus]|uniref:Uncharacterized protein n=1 Tax=Paracoccus saliphilus TaxID=405559 RepID=A0AA45W2Z1_9RHOB|nr:hypothetical protein SAMN05421772_103218 [Paracoccus saliphilus]
MIPILVALVALSPSITRLRVFRVFYVCARAKTKRMTGDKGEKCYKCYTHPTGQVFHGRFTSPHGVIPSRADRPFAKEVRSGQRVLLGTVNAGIAAPRHFSRFKNTIGGPLP